MKSRKHYPLESRKNIDDAIHAKSVTMIDLASHLGASHRALEFAESDIEERIEQNKILMEVCDNRKRQLDLQDKEIINLKEISEIDGNHNSELICTLNDRDKTIASLLNDKEILLQQLKDCQDAAINKND